MSILTILRSGIKIADSVTKTLQATVSFEKYTPLGDGYTTAVYAAPVALRAIVDRREIQSPTAEGIVKTTRPTVLFIDISKLMAATAGQGVQNEDRITLPDGTTGPARTLSGFLDAGTGKNIYTEVYIG